MSNYIKKFLFAILIFMMPYVNSASKAVDTEDYEGSTTCALKIRSSQILSLEDSKVSLKSYVLSSVRSVARKAYDIVNYSTRNPRKTAIISVLIAYQIAAVAAQQWTECLCECKNPNGTSHREQMMMRKVPM